MKNRYKQVSEQNKRRPLSIHMRQRLREGLFLISAACALFLLVALISFQPLDPGWTSTGSSSKILNSAGRVGAFLADILLMLFGVVAYLFPFLLMIASWLNLREVTYSPKPHEKFFKAVGWLFLIFSCCALVQFYWHAQIALPAQAGGIVGDLLAKGLLLLFNKLGSTLLLITSLLCGITFVTGLSWFAVTEHLGAGILKLCQMIKKHWQMNRKNAAITKPIDKSPAVKREILITAKTITPTSTATVPFSAPKPAMLEKKKIDIDPSIKLNANHLPPIELLNLPLPAEEKAFNQLSLEALSQLVEERLSDFGVDVKVVAVLPGPVITRFELELAPGVKVSKIVGLAKDIARSLSTTSVRIVEVIPGKSVIGLEIPNENRETVMLREIVDSDRFVHSRSPVSLVLGKDISGEPVIVDLSKMPHLLVAGTTGSGKSVSKCGIPS